MPFNWTDIGQMYWGISIMEQHWMIPLIFVAIGISIIITKENDGTIDLGKLLITNAIMCIIFVYMGGWSIIGTYILILLLMGGVMTWKEMIRKNG